MEIAFCCIVAKGERMGKHYDIEKEWETLRHRMSIEELDFRKNHPRTMKCSQKGLVIYYETEKDCVYCLIILGSIGVSWESGVRWVI